MTTYYVRKSGSDGNAGTSSGTAWLTIDHAANNVSAGDIVWIGAGVYREEVTIDTSGTSGSEIEWRADIDGTQTGDAGLVVITTLTDETGTGGTGSVINLNGKTFNEFYDLIIGPAGTATTDYTIEATAGNTSYEGILFEGCTLIRPLDSSNAVLEANYNAGASMTGNAPLMRNCYIDGEVSITYGTFTADVACGWQFENCTAMNAFFEIDGPNSDPGFGVSDYKFTNCTLRSSDQTIIQASDQWNTGNTGRIDNCAFIMNGGAPVQITGDGGTWNGDNNKSTNDNPFSGIAGSNNAVNMGVLLGEHVDHICRKWFGWTPYAAYEQVQDIGSGYTSGGIDAGSATYAPAADMIGNSRPMGRGDDVGAVESRARGQQETTTVRTGSSSMKFSGAGYHESTMEVDGTGITISVYGRYDSNYSGGLPKLEVYQMETGTLLASDTMTGAANNWEELTASFTPSAGWIRIRLVSQDTSASGLCFFDDLV